MLTHKMDLSHWLWRFYRFTSAGRLHDSQDLAHDIYCRLGANQKWGSVDPFLLDGCKIVNWLLRAVLVLTVQLAAAFIIPGLCVGGLFYLFLITLATGGFPFLAALNAITSFSFSWEGTYLLLQFIAGAAILTTGGVIAGFWAVEKAGDMVVKIRRARRSRRNRNSFWTDEDEPSFLGAAYGSLRNKVCFRVEIPRG